ILAMGIYPQPFLRRMDHSVAAIMSRVQETGNGEQGIRNRQARIGNRESGVGVVPSVRHRLLATSYSQPPIPYSLFPVPYSLPRGWPMITFQPTDVMRILPEIILCGFGILIMLLDPFVAPGRRSWLGWLALVGVLAAAGGTLRTSDNPGL